MRTATYKNNKMSIIYVYTMIILAIIMGSILFTNINSNAAINKSLDLSQKQLILLSNYLYFEDTEKLIPIQDKLDSMKKDNKYNPDLINSPASGIKDSKAIEMFEDMESDAILSNLVAVDSIDTNIRAVAFVDKNCVGIKDAEAVVVFQGTKGLDEPWLDNLQGATEVETDMQLEAGAFFKRVEKTYNVSHVTGHSKGGNLSQYVTITSGENVRKCVSFDGQGFSKYFINKYKTQIKNNAYKITNICSYKEPVHAMLTPIASRVLLIKTDEDTDSLSSHVSSLLYEKEFFDENGTYLNSCLTKPTNTVKTVEKLSDYVVENISDESFEYASEKITPVLGYVMPLMQDTIAHEDMSVLEALYTELKEDKSAGTSTSAQ